MVIGIWDELKGQIIFAVVVLVCVFCPILPLILAIKVASIVIKENNGGKRVNQDL
jgi:hypothetical protein